MDSVSDTSNKSAVEAGTKDDVTVFEELTRQIYDWGAELGFQQLGICDTELGEHAKHLDDWLAAGRHGEMEYMERHGTRRSRPAELIEGTERIIAVRMNYLPAETCPEAILSDGSHAYVSRYALGRDYHKLMRNRLAKLWRRIEAYLEEAGIRGHTGRVFTDSAPVLEKAIAEKAGLGWIGKNTLVLSRDAGSWFFLGEIYTTVPLAVDEGAATNHCGSCTACMQVCPTNAIVAPYQLDARRCISYLTIEKRGEIPVEFRAAIGNRIFGCDDCQLYCPWNKYARHTSEDDFSPRHSLDSAALLALFEWSEAEFLSLTEGSAIRRTGYEGWLRNIAVALGNGPAEPAVIEALENRRRQVSPMVAEHIDWALARLGAAGDQ
ncbi:MAG: tRNA epoxyqueuosine(34) reductase QueG [Gammaproteobacteria bacterium]|nr:tRNA epoxyqueuosine(34) reductase QueG [Gammaproteobacteria bacterium]